MASAVTRLLQDSRLRTRLKERGLATAARFDVARASLSELSVFRLAGALKARERGADTAAYRRHGNPITNSQAVVRVLVSTTPGRSEENDALTQRVLLPLRHRALRNAVRVHEADAIEELDDPATGVCIVYDGTVRTTGEARQILERCLTIDADVVYGLARPLDFGNPGSEADAAAEFLVRNATRVVVPSEGVGAQLETYAAKVVVVAPALDERLWLEDTVHGERTLGDDTDDDLRGVVFGLGEDPVDGMVRDALAQLSDTLTAEAMPRRPDGSSGDARARRPRQATARVQPLADRLAAGTGRHAGRGPEVPRLGSAWVQRRLFQSRRPLVDGAPRPKRHCRRQHASGLG